MQKLIWGLAAATMMLAAPAHAVEVGKTMETEAEPAAVWAAVGDFCGIGEWHPAVTRCEQSEEGGKTRRTLTLGDGATLVEELVSRDDAAMTYTYRIIEGPLPVENYKSTITVTAAGKGSTISWNGTFDAKGATDAEAGEVVGGIYDAGLQGIAEKAGM
ncbi:SRPBCC family protein [Aurantimonas sp. A2-1-M11]|uniref:SRPBCC family protein n=1 Tax=Aurantimonas sp. A2-1-M11 TaxID=3113712 RepID=UPI002F9423C9